MVEAPSDSDTAAPLASVLGHRRKVSGPVSSLITPSRASTPSLEASSIRPADLLTKSHTTTNTADSTASASSLFAHNAEPTNTNVEQVHIEREGDALGFIRSVSHRAEIVGTGSVKGKQKAIATANEEQEEQELSHSDTAASEDDLPQRRYYILSSAGKPIYISHLAASRRPQTPGEQESEEERKLRQALEDEEEEQATTQVGVMQALISIFADEEGDKLRFITNGSTRIAFLLRSPLYLVCVSARGEPASTLRNHLENLYLQVLSLVSAGQLTRLFARMPNFDLRRLLEGTDGVLGTLLTRLQTDVSYPLEALQPVRVDPSLREAIATALLPPKGDARPKDLLYVALLANEQVVTLLRPRRHSVHPSDMHVLINTVESLREPESGSESWIPLCLPKFAPQGFVHAYVSFLPPHEQRIALLVVTGNRDGFAEISSWRKQIAAALEKKSLLAQLAASLTMTKDDLRVPGLRHYVYKSRTYVQITSPAPPSPALATLYAHAHAAIHHPTAPAKMHFLQTRDVAVLAWITQPFQLFLALNPCVSKSAVVAAANAVAKWAKTHEQELFITAGLAF